MDYHTTLIDSRQGVNLIVQEAKEMAAITPAGAVTLSDRYGTFGTGHFREILYNYIEGDVFHEIAGITVMDLRRQVSRKISKQKSKGYKKRSDRRYLQGCSTLPRTQMSL